MTKKEPVIIITIILVTVLKILLIPSYRSTDFDVHRNWLAITKHLPIREWYFDSVNGTTVHTLDYPPSFALFEYFISNNYITSYLLSKDVDIVNENCLALLGDHENDVIGMDCIIFQRCTVILFDIIFIIGSFLICQCFFFTIHQQQHGENIVTTAISSATKVSSQQKKADVAFILLISNSGLILLDHVHFQYNGMLLGILLSSIAMMLQSIKTNYHQQQQQQCMIKSLHQTIMTEKTAQINNIDTKKYDLLGAFLFALLLTFKHMYLTLAPFYFFYLLRRFCFTTIKVPTDTATNSNARESKVNQHKILQFSISSLLCLGTVVLITLIGPFIPFLINGNGQRQPKEQLLQIFSRLFPWQRGLCHDYWAGNVLALYLGMEKLMSFVEKVVPNHTVPLLSSPFPTIHPSTAAMVLFMGQMPAMYCSWKIGGRLSSFPISSSSTPITTTTNNNSNNIDTKGNTKKINLYHQQQEGLLHCIIFSALSSFMLAYHVHEKAIMTAIIPMTLLALTSVEHARLFLRLSTLGHFGLLPLLFQPTELLMKICLNVSFLVLSLHLLERIHNDNDDDDYKDGNDDVYEKKRIHLLTRWDKIGLGIMVLILIFAEVIHPLLLRPMDKFEFLPLMMISLWCAIGHLYCWIHSGISMYQVVKNMKQRA